MIPLSVDEVRALEAGTLTLGAEASRFTGVTIDSRATGPGDLFVAVGRGSEFVADALARGAAGALVPADAFAALAALGRAVRTRSTARIVAITGSTGKTSTKDILASLCRPHRRTVAAEASHNNEIGVPLTLARIEPDTEVVVLELAMRGRGQIAELAEIARPDIGVITSVGPAHLELLGTVEDVAAAKAELLTALPQGGVAIVPAGVPLLEAHLRRDLEIIRFGEQGDVVLVDFRSGDSESRLEIAAFGRSLTLELNVRSRYNAHNALAALAAYHALGLPLEQAQAGARSIVLSRWREEEFELEDGSLLLNDCYNANPMSMRAALAHLAERAGARRRVAVLGEMAELGPEAPAFHREIGAVAAESGVEVLLAVGSAGRDYLDGAGRIPQARWVPDVEAAIQELKVLLLPGDCVLVKGSRAVGLEAVAEALTSVAA